LGFLRIATQFAEKVKMGQKHSTIRLGRRPFSPGDRLYLVDEAKQVITTTITGVSYKRLIDLTDQQAERDGFQSLRELIEALYKIYPNITPESDLTIIEFLPEEESQEGEDSCWKR
jgi:hypothetical protein